MSVNLSLAYLEPQVKRLGFLQQDWGFCAWGLRFGESVVEWVLAMRGLGFKVRVAGDGELVGVQ